MKNKSLLIVFLAMYLGACGKVSSSGGLSTNPGGDTEVGEDSIPNTLMEGSVEGSPWQLAQGLVRMSYSGSGTLNLSFGNEKTAEQCPFVLGSKKSLLVDVPAKVGEYTLGQLPQVMTATFSIYTDGYIKNLFASKGRVIISEITATEVKGSLAIMLDSGTRVRGQFSVPFCGTHTQVATPEALSLTTERSLGVFDLRVNASSGSAASNPMNVNRPDADVVYADFKFNPEVDTRLGFYTGTSGGFNCRPWGIKKSFEVKHVDEQGNVLDSKIYEGFPDNVAFLASQKYIIRHSLSNFPEYCESITTSFLVVRK